jgi:hypothetical protein
MSRRLIDETKEYVVEVINMIAAREFPCTLEKFLEEFKKETGGYKYEFDPYSIDRSVVLGEWIVGIQRGALDIVHAYVDGELITIAFTVDRIIAKNAKGDVILISMKIGEVWTVTDEDLFED